MWPSGKAVASQATIVGSNPITRSVTTDYWEILTELLQVFNKGVALPLRKIRTWIEPAYAFRTSWSPHIRYKQFAFIHVRKRVPKGDPKIITTILKFCGVALIDLRNNNQDDHIKVLEINPRYWGSLIGALSTGVNFLYFACLSGLGIPFDRPDYIHKIT